MPQMMPMNWIISILFFILIFILFNIMNYYIFNMKFQQNIFLLKKNKKLLIWKW